MGGFPVAGPAAYTGPLAEGIRAKGRLEFTRIWQACGGGCTRAARVADFHRGSVLSGLDRTKSENLPAGGQGPGISCCLFCHGAQHKPVVLACIAGRKIGRAQVTKLTKEQRATAALLDAARAFNRRTWLKGAVAERRPGSRFR